MAQLQQERQAVDAGVENSVRKASEQRAVDKIDGQLNEVRQWINEERAADERRQADAGVHRRLGTGNSSDGRLGLGADTIYARGSGNSYFRDLVSSVTPGSPTGYEAQQRLNEHAQVIDRAAADLPAEWRATRERRAAGSNLETRVNPNRTDGQGGFFVPPLWLVDEYVALLRAGRALADRCNVRPLPPGTDSVNLPKVATGTTTGVQTADAGTVSSTDLTDTQLTGPVRTIAGQQDVALQLVEQSPGNFDEVVFADLIADYNMRLDAQVINGSGAAGQMQGILGIAGNTVTYTDATPTLPELWVPVAQSMSKVASTRFLPPDTIGMTPSQWYWWVSQLDTTNRPLIGGATGASMNSLAVYDETAAEGVAGAIGNTSIVIDANIPSNLGAGTNETRIITGRYKDAWLYEGALRTRALMEVLSGTLQVRLQVYNYAAFIPNRYPTAFAALAGTGMIPQAGF